MEQLNRKAMLIRYGAPSKYDHCEYGTLCKVMTNNRDFDLYMQIGKNESDPLWNLMGTFDSDEEAYKALE